MVLPEVGPESGVIAVAVDHQRPVVAVNDRDEVQIHELRDRHWTVLYVAILVIAASFLLQVGDADDVKLSWLHIELPELCASRMLFGVECPGCGLTRSFVSLAAGDLQESLRFHRVGWLLALALIGQLPYRVYALWELRWRTVERSWLTWFGYLLIAALIVNWLLIMCDR